MKRIAEAKEIGADTRRLVALVSSPFTSTLAFFLVSSSALTLAEESHDRARWAQAAQIAKQLTTPIIINSAYGDMTKGLARPYALGEAAKIGGRIAEAKDDTALFDQALDLAEDIEDQEVRSEALRTIVESLSLMAQRRGDTALAARALNVALRLPRPELGRLIDADESYRASNGYTSDARNDHRSRALASVARTFASLARAKYDTRILDQAIGITGEIIDANSKAEVFGIIASSIAFIAQERENGQLLARALEIAEGITQAFDKDYALSAIAYAAAILGDWGEALWIARQSGTDTEKARTLSRILIVWAERNSLNQARPKPGGPLHGRGPSVLLVLPGRQVVAVGRTALLAREPSR